jgi:hypothetical protein
MQKTVYRVMAALLVLMTFSTLGVAKDKTLYDNLGKKKGIESVVTDFVGRCAADPRIKGFRSTHVSWLTRRQRHGKE